MLTSNQERIEQADKKEAFSNRFNKLLEQPERGALSTQAVKKVQISKVLRQKNHHLKKYRFQTTSNWLLQGGCSKNLNFEHMAGFYGLNL